MTRIDQLPPDLQALERERLELARRAGHLAPNSELGRRLRKRNAEITRQALLAEARLSKPHQDITQASLQASDPPKLSRGFWWEDQS